MNCSSEPVSLKGFIIGDGTGFDPLVTVNDGTWLIQPHSYALILDPDYFTADEPYGGIPGNVPLFTVGDKALGSGGLSNSTAEPVYLISADGDTLSKVYYALDCPPGHSWERILPAGDDGIDNFRPSKDIDGTPGRPNSVLPPSKNPALDEHSLRFSPLQPVMGGTLEVYVTYINRGLEPGVNISVAVSMLPDSYASGTVNFPDGVSPGERSPEASRLFKNLPGGCLGFMALLSAGVDGTPAEDDSLRVELLVPVTAGALILNEIMAAPAEGTPEWVEVLNTSASPVDLYRFSIRDRSGRTSEPVDHHVFVQAHGYAVIAGGQIDTVQSGAPVIAVKKFPALNNDGDSIGLLDSEGAVIDSMSYDEAPPGCSLELISPGMRGNPSGWDRCVDSAGATPGMQNSIYFASAPGEDETMSGSPELKVNPNPFLNETTISYTLPFPLARVRLLVYDRRGRLVATIRDVKESGSSWIGTWDGKSGGSRLPAGPYILDFEALDKRTGKMYRLRETIVAASNL